MRLTVGKIRVLEGGSNAGDKEDTMTTETGTWKTCFGCDGVYAGEVCTKCQAEASSSFDDAMWGWLEPVHVAMAEHEARTGEIPAA